MLMLLCWLVEVSKLSGARPVELAGRVYWVLVFSCLLVLSCVDKFYDSELAERASLAFWC